MSLAHGLPVNFPVINAQDLIASEAAEALGMEHIAVVNLDVPPLDAVFAPSASRARALMIVVRTQRLVVVHVELARGKGPVAIEAVEALAVVPAG
jgi:nicotinic acid mononucleotide adenylyltransferase